MERVALWPLPPAMVKLQLPAATGVTVKVVPDTEIIAIPEQFVVLEVNEPL